MGFIQLLEHTALMLYCVKGHFVCSKNAQREPDFQRTSSTNPLEVKT